MIYTLDQQDLINATRRNEVCYRSIPVKGLQEYTQHQHLLQLHSSQLSHKVPGFKRNLYYCSHSQRTPSANTAQQRTKPGSLPSWGFINRSNPQHNLSTSFLPRFHSHQDLLLLSRILSSGNRLLFPPYPISPQPDPLRSPCQQQLCPGAGSSSCP